MLARRVRLAGVRAPDQRVLELATRRDPLHQGARRRSSGGREAADLPDPRLAGRADRVPRADPAAARGRSRRCRPFAARVRVLRDAGAAAQRRRGRGGVARADGRRARLRRFVVQGGDWGSIIAARGLRGSRNRACAAPERPVGAAGTGAFDEPPLSERESAIAQAQRWRTREGFHLIVHGMAPDALGVGLTTHRRGLPPGWPRSTAAGATAAARSSALLEGRPLRLPDPVLGDRDDRTVAAPLRRRGPRSLAPATRRDDLVAAAVADFPPRSCARRGPGPSACFPICAAGPRCRAAATSPPSRSRGCSPTT